MPLNALPDSFRTALLTSKARTQSWRWGVVLLCVLLVHGLVGIWFARHRDLFAANTQKPPVEVALLRPERIAREPAQASPRGGPPAATRAQRRTSTAHSKASSEHVLQALEPAESTSAAPLTPASAAASPASGTSEGTTNGAAQAAAATEGSKTGHADEKTNGVKFSVPPSGEFRYDTFFNGVQNAVGTIHWTSDGNGYEIIVSVPLPFVGTFTYASRGRVDAFGLAPDRYVEHRGRRPEEVTTFDRQARRIGFTRTSATLALPDGAQDRFSMVMQLASLVRGDPDAYRPGVTRNFYVADDNSGEIWPIETIGDETVRTAAGFVSARHFMRLPRRANDARRIDVWLAPALGWLPARIRQTEPNGTLVELVWRGPLTAPGPENASVPTTPGESPGVAPTELPTREKP
ncbi:DUF3108 domain-containing protein [Trinickia sp. LjRoot230]|uniref:DUF3108 domain-containing protein n=1 Tax=Trinickia sp. LjRoot230 TaxID=3342288 RepID=UPI003ECD1068